MKQSVLKKLKQVKLLLLDVDGVLTDGHIVFDPNGRELKFFDVQDGFGLVVLKRFGIKVAIISAKSAPAVAKRMKDLRIDKVCQNAYPKLKVYQKLLKEFHLTDKDVCFICDDLPDLAVLKSVGLGVAVPNAVAEIKRQAHYVTKKAGGHGAVREVVELILKAQGKWQKCIKEFS